MQEFIASTISIDNVYFKHLIIYLLSGDMVSKTQKTKTSLVK